MTAIQSPVERLEAQLKCSWQNLRDARERTRSRRDELREILSKPDPIDSSERSVVAFGSIAREEATDESDLDWTLLIDGQADPQHLRITHEIRRRLKAATVKEPGPTGTFGKMTFSHELIHNIGGEDDTNRNLTRRLLLLLESVVVGGDSQAYNRVITNVLQRYIPEEENPAESGGLSSVPRFLLNDVARLWRTIAVDFATKQWERQGADWGLRATKLRFSRKLVFASGLLTCYRSVSKPINEFVRMTPLNTLADALLAYEVDSAPSKEIFTCYDEYLGMVSDNAIRSKLKEIKPGAEAQSDVFQRIRDLGHRFQDALDKVFFDHQELGKLTRKYGVF